jgi:hypothetical protein
MIMDSNIHENHSDTAKTNKTGPVHFLRFTENRSLTIQKIKYLRNFEKPKKIEQFTVFIQNLNFE